MHGKSILVIEFCIRVLTLILNDLGNGWVISYNFSLEFCWVFIFLGYLN